MKIVQIENCGQCPYVTDKYSCVKWFCNKMNRGASFDRSFPAWCPLPDASQQTNAVERKELILWLCNEVERLKEEIKTGEQKCLQSLKPQNL